MKLPFKFLFGVTSAILLVLSGRAAVIDNEDEDVMVVDASTAPFIFASHAAGAPALGWLAGIVSNDYRSAPDEFAEHDLLLEMKPGLTRKLQNAKSQPEYVLVIGAQLGRFDFERQAFPSPVPADAVVRFGDFAAVFSNAKDYAWLPLEEKTARSFQLALRKSRNVRITLKLTVDSAKQVESPGDGTVHQLTFRIKSLALTHEDGRPMLMSVQ